MKSEQRRKEKTTGGATPSHCDSAQSRTIAGEQPDLYIQFIQGSSRKIIADVVVTNCQAPSYRGRATWNCKSVLADSETQKESKYAHLAVPNQAQIIGLAFDALGGIGPHAQELINYICVLSQESPLLLSPRDFVSLLRDRISIALAQRAGALVEEGESRVLNARLCD